MTRARRTSSIPPSGRSAQSLAKEILRNINTLAKERKMVISCKRIGQLNKADASTLVRSVIPGLEINLDVLDGIVAALLQHNFSFEDKMKVPVRHLIAMRGRSEDRSEDIQKQNVFERKVPSIIAFYSIMIAANRGMIKLSVQVDKLGETIDVQDIPGANQPDRARIIFETMQEITARALGEGSTLVDAQEFFEAWLADGSKAGGEYLFRDIFEEATSPEQQD